MLERTRKKLDSLFANEPQVGSDGQMHDMDGVTKINLQQCEYLAELHEKMRPTLSMEIGLAYGFSTLPILDVMTERDYGHHIAIDPGQLNYWNGVTLKNIEELGFSDKFTWLGQRSDRALPALVEERRRAQFIFFDGLHHFDAVIADFVLANQLLDVGGLLIVNDMWLPGIRSIASFMSSNLPHYETFPSGHDNVFILRKTKEDDRSWDYFVPFDGAGSAADQKPERKQSFLRKLLS